MYGTIVSGMYHTCTTVREIPNPTQIGKIIIPTTRTIMYQREKISINETKW